jgi:hypothetical protein
LTTGSGTNFIAADNVTATYSRVSGEDASPPTYHITATLNATPLSALDNYIITNDGAEFTIDKRLATWTTNGNSKTYGDPDPNPITTGSGSNFVPADNVTATYSRAPGETVLGGPYHITATLSATPISALDNYIITNTGADFTISTRPATWTTNPNSKTYGNPDPSPLTTGSGSGFLLADGVTATYSRASGETVLGGPYHITATLAPSGVLSNYSITNTGAAFTITTRPATWTTSPNSKTYGDADPNPLTTGSGNFVAGDNVTATYSRAAGETVLGGPYHITATLAPAGVLSNYSITNAGAHFTINTRPATWTTNPNSKTYGNADPVPLTTGSGSNFVADDGVTASYSRAAGETVAGGPYHITATLSPAGVLSNYSITNNGANFTINRAHLTVTANNKSKAYDGNPFTAFTVTITGFKFMDTVAVVSGSATYTGSAIGATLPGTYTITPQQGTLSAANYDFPPGSPPTGNFVNGTLTIGYGTCTGSDPGGVILPPINSDGSSVYKRKGGSTIPVKFKVCDANGNSISDPNVVFQTGCCGSINRTSHMRGTVENVNENSLTDIPDVAFRYVGDHWQFNMDTGNLTAGYTDTFQINLKYGVIQFTIQVK